MKICIDVDVLNAIASDARKANSECLKAYQIINFITKGTAWVCREKDDINDNLKSLNRQINNLSEDFSTFAITADSVATNFRDYVYSIDKKYLKDMKSMIGIFGFAAGEVTNIATNVGRKTQILMSELSNKVYGKLFNLNTASIVAACTIPGTIVPFVALNMGQHQGSSLANSLINSHNSVSNNSTANSSGQSNKDEETKESENTSTSNVNIVDISTKVEEIKKKPMFQQNAPWNGNTNHGGEWNGIKYRPGTGCCDFSSVYQIELTGKTWTKELTNEQINIDDIHIGDSIYYKFSNGGHWVTVNGIDGDKISVAEGNYGPYDNKHVNYRTIDRQTFRKDIDQGGYAVTQIRRVE